MKRKILFFGLLFSFGLGFAQTEEKLTPEEKERRERNIQAGNPFKKFGYTPKIATLSKGKYLEWHDLDSIVRIGSYSFHVKEKAITGYNMNEDKNSEATLRPELTSRWLSPDPLAEEFPSWSPYNFVMNNPIRYIDPTGLAPEDWRNKDGLLIYDPTANNGQGAYTEHATRNDKNIGNALQATATGREQFNKLVNSEQVIQIDIDSGRSADGAAGKTANGPVAAMMDLSTGKIEDVSVEKSVITVFMGNVGDLADADANGMIGKLNGTAVNGMTFAQIIGAVVGHEIEHTTKENIIIQQTPGATEKQIEQKPTDVSNKIIRESLELNKQ